VNERGRFANGGKSQPPHPHNCNFWDILSEIKNRNTLGKISELFDVSTLGRSAEIRAEHLMKLEDSEKLCQPRGF